MDTTTIRNQLHQYLEIADDKKLKAIYVMLEDSIKDLKVEYTEELKAELDKRVEYYLSGGLMVTPVEMNERLLKIRDKRNGG
jgi:hypothetical protein